MAWGLGHANAPLELSIKSHNFHAMNENMDIFLIFQLAYGRKAGMDLGLQ
jgi:hypothetical protein